VSLRSGTFPLKGLRNSGIFHLLYGLLEKDSEKKKAGRDVYDLLLKAMPFKGEEIEIMQCKEPKPTRLDNPTPILASLIQLYLF